MILDASYSQTEFIIFVGNLPYSCTIQQFKDITKPYGQIERIFIVHSEQTGHSKGYGFVEYRKKLGLRMAKRDLVKNNKELKIESSNNGLYEYSDLQSQTLLVTKFPGGTTSEQIEKIINQHVQVPFCKVRMPFFVLKVLWCCGVV